MTLKDNPNKEIYKFNADIRLLAKFLKSMTLRIDVYGYTHIFIHYYGI